MLIQALLTFARAGKATKLQDKDSHSEPLHRLIMANQALL